jgi:unsaturated chondroitin disaccharide hydrolase
VSTRVADTRTAHAERAFAWIRAGVEPVLELIEQAPDGAVPRFKYTTGGYALDEAYLPDAWSTFQWTGFLAGRLWLLADHFNDDRVRAAAERLATTVAAKLATAPPRFSAAGSDLFYAVCLGARATESTALTQAGLAGARQYSQNFDECLGVFFQVAGVNRAVIDTGLNLLPAYWSQDSDLLEVALTHHRTLLDAGIIRADGSAFQAVEFDRAAGVSTHRYTMQGYRDDSTWARGQAWAIHGHVNAFEATGDGAFLDIARRTARWFADHRPADGVPFYDFDDPAAPDVPRDSCAAAIAACGLLKLARLDPPSAAWAQPAADAVLDVLLEDHLSPGGVLLHSSWGRLPPDKAGAGFSRFPLEDVMPYGNYWVVEGLWRRLHADWSLLALGDNQPATA